MSNAYPEIIGIGSTVYDTLMVVDRYPTEDTKLEDLETKVQGGGPCATALVAARKLGVSVAYMGTVGDDPFGRFMLDDLQHWGVSTEYVRRVPGCVSFHSVVLLNQSNASRTCVWSKGTVPPPEESDLNWEALKHAKVLHLDGHMLNAAIAAGIVPQALQGQYTSNITRQEFCALAVQMLTVRLELDEGSLAHIEGARDGVPKFTDCGDSHVVTAWCLGIVDGVGNGSFAPDRSITRQEAAAMLTRAAKVLDLTARGTAAAFADSGDVADWAKEPVDFVSRLGVMGGVGNGKFGPTGTYTREQAMLTMLRLFEVK